MSRILGAIGVIALVSCSAFSQETRSTLAGRVLGSEWRRHRGRHRGGPKYRHRRYSELHH
jgi:hypothetical protein